MGIAIIGASSNKDDRAIFAHHSSHSLPYSPHRLRGIEPRPLNFVQRPATSRALGSARRLIGFPPPSRAPFDFPSLPGRCREKTPPLVRSVLGKKFQHGADHPAGAARRARLALWALQGETVRQSRHGSGKIERVHGKRDRLSLEEAFEDSR